MSDTHALAIQQRQFPPVVGVSDLSVLLQKAPTSILADRARAPWRLPPDCTPPGSRQPLWLLQDILDWLGRHRQPETPPPAQPAMPLPPRRRGRPTKAEHVARRLGEEAAAKAAEGGAA